MSKRRLLLLSNSRNNGQGYLAHAKSILKEFLGQQVGRVLFIPYARVIPTLDDYASIVREGFKESGYKLDSLHELKDPHEAIRTAEAIVVGGGNTFQLLHTLQEKNLLDGIKARLEAGVPYIGWSAGANIACPSIKTTNDMPIVELQNFKALGMVPFQINPHYVDFLQAEERTETREERILEFVEVNADVYVVGLREGSILRVEGSNISLSGDEGARVFRKGKETMNYAPQDSLQFLLD